MKRKIAKYEFPSSILKKYIYAEPIELFDMTPDEIAKVHPVCLSDLENSLILRTFLLSDESLKAFTEEQISVYTTHQLQYWPIHVLSYLKEKYKKATVPLMPNEDNYFFPTDMAVSKKLEEAYDYVYIKKSNKYSKKKYSGKIKSPKIYEATGRFPCVDFYLRFNYTVTDCSIRKENKKLPEQLSLINWKENTAIDKKRNLYLPYDTLKEFISENFYWYNLKTNKLKKYDVNHLFHNTPSFVSKRELLMALREIGVFNSQQKCRILIYVLTYFKLSHLKFNVNKFRYDLTISIPEILKCMEVEETFRKLCKQKELSYEDSEKLMRLYKYRKTRLKSK